MDKAVKEYLAKFLPAFIYFFDPIDIISGLSYIPIMQLRNKTQKETGKMKNLELVFDNGGGLTIQRDDYAHYYDGQDGFAQAAEDYKLLCKNSDVSDWDGNDSESRIEYTDEQVRNGGYRVFCKSQDLDPDRRFGWRNIDEFQKAYFGKSYGAE